MEQGRRQTTRHAGEQVGEWTLDDPLGSGAFGEVWSAHSTADTSRRSALKIARDDLGADLLRREVTALASLNSSRFPRVIGVHFDTSCYAALELVPGKTLRQVLMANADALPIDESVRIALEVLRALEDAHAVGLVHRDVKPENVMVADDGRVLLIDLGLSLPPELDHSLVGDDAVAAAGSAPYLAPEVRGGAKADAQADLYAWGVVFFELLTGVLPAAAELPSTVRQDVPPKLDEVYTRACARRAARFASAAEARTALEGALAPAEAGSTDNTTDPTSLEFFVAQILELAAENVDGPLWECIRADEDALLGANGGPFKGDADALATVKTNMQVCAFALGALLAHQDDEQGGVDLVQAVDALWALTVSACLFGQESSREERAAAIEQVAQEAIRALLGLYDASPDVRTWNWQDDAFVRLGVLHAAIVRARRDLLGDPDGAARLAVDAVLGLDEHPLKLVLAPKVIASCAEALGVDVDGLVAQVQARRNEVSAASVTALRRGRSRTRARSQSRSNSSRRVRPPAAASRSTAVQAAEVSGGGVMSQVWEIRKSAKKLKGTWTSSPFTLAQEAKDDARRSHSYSFRNEKAGLWCKGCQAAYSFPACECGKTGYRAVLFAEGGAGLACTRCETLFAAWTCPDCGATAKLNTSMAMLKADSRLAGGCCLLAAILLGCVVLGALGR